MEKWSLAVETNCSDPSREKESNDWYDNIHVPDILEMPEVVRAARYENGSPAEGWGEFLALYEIETDDIGQTMMALQENVSKKWHMNELAVTVSGAFYQQITAPVERK